MTTRTPWGERIGSASERAWRSAAFGLLVLIAVADFAITGVTLAILVVLAPLLASVRLPPREVALAGLGAVAVMALSWIWTDADAQQVVRLALVVAGSILAYLIALARSRVERERLLEGLLEQLVASTTAPPADLVAQVAEAIVPQFADGARVSLQPAGNRPRVVGRAGAEPADDDGDQPLPGVPVVRVVDGGQVLLGPLDVGARRVGEIRLYRRRRFTGEDLELFDRLTDRVALALENSLLLADSQALTARLDDEHRWLQAVVDQMPSAVTIRDADGAELVVNRRAERIQRRAAGEGDAQTWFRAHPGRRIDGGSSDPEQWPHMRALREGEVVTGEEYQIERHDGTWGVVRVNAAPIRDDRDRIVAAVSVFDDTTEQHRDQRALRWLAEVGRLLDRPHTVETRIEEILDLLVAELADAGLIYLARSDGSLQLQRVVLAAAEDGQPLLDLPDAERAVPADHPAAVCLARRSTLEVAGPDAIAVGGDWLAQHGLGGALFVPIVHAQRNHGCLALVSTARRTQDPRDVKVLELIARRIALALENSQLYAEQHRVATALQRDLLPAALPDWPGMELATLHSPARSAADVGGDFFDLFEAGDRRMLVVGDVSGKGVEAAATTALVRHAVRVAARADQPVAERLATVNEAVLQDAPGDQFCTLAWAAFGSAGGEVVGEIACAGHPPPFIVRAGGGVEAVDASGTLLGFFHDLRSVVAPVRLGAGDAIVLFTDGVTEARLPDGSLFGADGVRDALAATGDRTADGLLDALEAALDAARAEARDDVAIVIGRVAA